MRLPLVAVVSCFLFAASARAQDLPTTHDHGITITPDHLTAAIQESQDFWGPVRKYLAAADCTLGDASPRAEATAFLKQIHDGLHGRLFGDSEADAMDLVLFLGHRLRGYEVYRRLHVTLADEAAMLAVLETSQRVFREINRAPAEEQPAQRTELAEKLVAELRTRGTPAEKLAEAEKLVKTLIEVNRQMSSTGAGQMLVGFEAKAKQLDQQVAALLREITIAADWVQIVRTEGVEIGRADFVKAVADLKHLRGNQTAAAEGATTR
jgi:hypothetical protein